jgi:hypothetical protein
MLAIDTFTTQVVKHIQCLFNTLYIEEMLDLILRSNRLSVLVVSCSRSQCSSGILEVQRFNQKCLPVDPILKQFNSAHVFTLFFFDINFNNVTYVLICLKLLLFHYQYQLNDVHVSSMPIRYFIAILLHCPFFHLLSALQNNECLAAVP